MYGDGTRFHSRNMKCGNSVDSTFAGSPAELWGSGKVCRNGCSCVGSKHIFDHDSQLTIVLVYFRLMLLEISEHGHSPDQDSMSFVAEERKDGCPSRQPGAAGIR